jgi:hypothetical protein
MPEVELWEAVALSLDCEPNSVKDHQGMWRTGELAEFKDRLQIASRNLGTQKALRPMGGLVSGNPTVCLVRLTEFAAWAVSLGHWAVPQEFAALASYGVSAPQAMTAEQHALWAGKDAWTIRETVFLLCGRLPDLSGVNDHELNEARDNIRRALTVGSLHIIGEPTKAEQMHDLQLLDPREVARWALGMPTKLPILPSDFPYRGPTEVTDYECGRILITITNWLDTEVARRRRANENSTADALALVQARINDLLTGKPLAAKQIEGLNSAPTLGDSVSEPRNKDKQQTAHLNTIGALLELLLDKSGSGRPFPSAAALIAAIHATHPGKVGLSERSLEERFAQAKRSLVSD